MEIERKNQSQIKYIIKKIGEKSDCRIHHKYQNNIDNLTTPLIKNILKYDYISGQPMKTLQTLLQTFITSSNVSYKNGIYNLNISFEKWTKNLKKLKVVSSESNIYVATLPNDIQVIVKIPKVESRQNDILKEYYIGFNCINNLRYYVPNFVYTFGAFIYPFQNRKLISVIFEKIPGFTLSYALSKNILTFEEYINIFFQILIALEVAQKNVQFCHFDLHTGNIMLRPISKKITYTVVLGLKQYTITASKYIPVIIDFGMSSVTDEKKTIGSFYFAKYGMMNYMISGVDMYKLLSYSYIKSSDSLKSRIKQLFIFFQDKDPYNILNNVNVEQITSEYAKKVTFSLIASYTPLKYANWIFSHYKKLIKCKLSQRTVYIPIKKLCVNIYKDNITSSLLSILKNSYSFILHKYVKYIINKCNNLFNLDKKLIENETIKNKKILIRTDKKFLMLYKSLKVPNIKKLQKYIDVILNIRINSERFDKKIIKNFLRYASFYKKINSYLQLMYTIKELKLEKKYKTYKTFITSFTNSQQYKMYRKTYEDIEQTIRWCLTLLNQFKEL